MKEQRTYYQIFADSVYGSDIVEKDTLNEARKVADEWAKTSKCKIVVLKVTEQIVLEVSNNE